MWFVVANMEKDESENTKESLKDSESLDPEKKGGPYTKKEQEERKIQVYHLHFEENKSALEIAELLNVNRNTINDDIKYWHQQFAKEFKAQDLTAKMTKQIQRMEIQRDRLFDDLEEVENFDEKIKLEKFVSDVDNRLGQLFSKMISSGKTILAPTVKLNEINDDEIKELVRDLVLVGDPNVDDVFSENYLMHHLIEKTHCDVSYTENVIEKMRKDGLEICKQLQHIEKNHILWPSFDNSLTYNLAKFGTMRGYISMEEYISFWTERQKIRSEIKKEEEIVEKFEQKYGPESEWSEQVQEMFEGSLEDPE